MMDSEFRIYPFIEHSLKELGWNTKNPSSSSDGEVYTQGECLKHPAIKEALNNNRPENLVKVDEDTFWVIEAKQGHSRIEVAKKEAFTYAKQINRKKKIQCLFATGVAGSKNNSYLVESYFFSGDNWERISLNGYNTTGFLSKATINKIIQSNSGSIEEAEIPDEQFVVTANKINEILHKGAINKRHRAKVIASLLLALVEDEYLKISDSPITLIKDINARVESILEKYEKGSFSQEIALHLPTSRDNHRKHRRALVDSIQELKNLNIRSAINSNRDILGQFYETFLKYANDAKEIGIVLTPRHITEFAAESLNISSSDYVYDPTCGTGGFLVSAFDKVKQKNPAALEKFRKSNIYGVEQDAEIVALALVNMIFRGDGKSNIFEGNTFDNFFFEKNGKKQRIKTSALLSTPNEKRFITKVLMNPPFAQNEKEFEFVNHALHQMAEGGLLFAVLPTSTMCAQTTREINWRKGLLSRHTLKAVIKLSEDLFMPNAHKGTYAVVVEAWKPHRKNSHVMWALMDDGFVMKKAKRLPSKNLPTNMHQIRDVLKKFLVLEEEESIKSSISFSAINFDDAILDCSPEAYLPYNDESSIELSSISLSLATSLIKIKKVKELRLKETNYKLFPLDTIFSEVVRGDCPPANSLPAGATPLISTTEENNGIEGFYENEKATLWKDAITIPANGSKYKSFYHPYNFYALPDVLICNVKGEFSEIYIKLYICAILNQYSWRFSYFRKCNEYKLNKDVMIPLPVKEDGSFDFDFMHKNVSNTKGVEIINNLLLLDHL